MSLSQEASQSKITEAPGRLSADGRSFGSGGSAAEESLSTSDYDVPWQDDTRLDMIAPTERRRNAADLT